MSTSAGAAGDQTLAITMLGSAARAVIDVHAHGRVLAVFRRSFYLRFDSDVICIGSAEIGLGPLNALCAPRNDAPWADGGVGIDAEVTRSTTLLHVAGRLRFDLAGADVWQPPVATAVDFRVLAQSLERLGVSVMHRAPGGLGALCKAVSPGFDRALQRHDDSLLRAAAPGVLAVRGWLGRALTGSTEVPPPVVALIGLGPGLTPSGDDFLAGVMIALHYLSHGNVARRLADVVLPSAARDTSLVSAAYLRCAAAGEGSKVLFDALDGLFAGDDALLAQRLDAIDGVGHTSGWDCLAGAVTVCAVMTTLAAPRPPVPPRGRWKAPR